MLFRSIEVMAHRGPDPLRFGPMKPVGLKDPRTGRAPYAVVQLRQDTLAADHFSLVGFQTQLKWSEQARVLRLIPGLESAEFVRFGMVHRNTYINGPTVLRETWQTRARPDLFFAGQISGVEGYVESAASGLLAGRNAAAVALGEPPQAAPRTTAIGALAYYASHAEPRGYQPTNITFGIMPPPEDGGGPRSKASDRKAKLSARALADLDAWLAPVAPASLAQGTSQDANAGASRPSSEAVMLVARPELQNELLGSSILLVLPLDNGGHAGFIVNKPTAMTLGQAFPDDEPSQKVQEPLFLGGPVSPNIIFALVKRPDSPGADAIRFTKDLFLAMSSDTVDRIIQNESDHARFFAGAMVWRPGELKEQIENGAWYVSDASAEVALSRNVDHLWDDLVADAEKHANTF